jgi:hypothetical protein
VRDDADVDSLITTYAPRFLKEVSPVSVQFQKPNIFSSSFSAFPVAALAESRITHIKIRTFYYDKINHIDSSPQAAVMVPKPAQG